MQLESSGFAYGADLGQVATRTRYHAELLMGRVVNEVPTLVVDPRADMEHKPK